MDQFRISPGFLMEKKSQGVPPTPGEAAASGPQLLRAAPGGGDLLRHQAGHATVAPEECEGKG